MSAARDLTLTHHATQRCKEMRVDVVVVENIFDHAEIIYPSFAGRSLAVAQEISVVFNPESCVAITVLWTGAIGRDAEGQPIR